MISKHYIEQGVKIREDFLSSTKQYAKFLIPISNDKTFILVLQRQTLNQRLHQRLHQTLHACH